MKKISLVEILTLLIATIILLVTLYSATFDDGKYINFKFGKIFGEAPFSRVSFYADKDNIDNNSIIIP